MSDSPEPCELLAWDTAFFGRRIARVHPGALPTGSLDAVDQWCDVHRVDCAYLLVDVADALTRGAAAGAGFAQVDVRMTLQRDDDGGWDRGAAHGVVARPGDADDVERVRTISSGSFRDSRFFFDPGFDEDDCVRLYDAWVRREFELAQSRPGEHRVSVVEQAGAVVAFASGHVVPVERGRPGADQSPGGEIGLVAVAQDARGEGLGSAAVRDVTTWLYQRGCPSVHVVTQGRNVRAQRVYEGLGFLLRAQHVWFHKWYRPANQG